MSCQPNMGNCNSNRHKDAESEANNGAGHSPGASHELNTSELFRDREGVIHEQITSQNAKSMELGSSTRDGGEQSPNGVDKLAENRTENDAVIDFTRAQVNSLLDGIHQYEGTSSTDKDYRYFDEMLTRCILNLDSIQCKDAQDRVNRKEAIRGVNEAISILERKLEINNEIKNLTADLEKDDQTAG